MKENKKKGWFDFLRSFRSSLSKSQFEALFDHHSYYSRELEQIAIDGAKNLVDQWALEVSKKASKQLQGDVTLPDYRFLPDVQWENGVFSYNVNGKEVKDDRNTQVSRLKELSAHYGLPLPDDAEEVVSRDSYEKILSHYYKDDKGNVFKPEPSGDLRLDLESVPLIPVSSFISDSNVVYGNITMEDFSKLKLVSMSSNEVNDFKERSRKAVDGSNLLKQTIVDITTYLNGELYFGSAGFDGRVPDSMGLSFRTSGSPLSFPVDSYHANDDYTITLLSHKAMQNGEPVHLDIDKNNAWHYTSILSKLDNYILESSNKDIKEMNDVVRRLEKLSKDTDQQFITRKDKNTVVVDYNVLSDKGQELLFRDAGAYERSLDKFCIHGNRNVELEGSLTENGQSLVDAWGDKDYVQDPDAYKNIADSQTRQALLDALKAKEKELIHTKELKVQAEKEYEQVKKYDDRHFKDNLGDVYIAKAAIDSQIGHGYLNLYPLDSTHGLPNGKPNKYSLEGLEKNNLRLMSVYEVNEWRESIEKASKASEQKNIDENKNEQDEKSTVSQSAVQTEQTQQQSNEAGEDIQQGSPVAVPLPDREMDQHADLESRGWQKPESAEETSGRWHTPAMKENDAYRVYSKLLIAKMGNQNINENTPWVSKNTGIPKSIDGKKFGGIVGLMLAMNTEKEGYDLPIYMSRTEASSMQLRVEPFAITFPAIVKDGEVKDLYNIDQTDFKEQHPRQYEQLSRDNAAEIRMKENNAISLHTLAKNGLWYVPVKEDGKKDLSVFSLADKSIHIAPLSAYGDQGDNYYRDLTIAMVSSNRLNNTNSSFKRFLKEDLISHLGSAMLSQKYRFSFNANNPDVSHFWKDMLRNNANTTKSVLRAAEASANRVYSRVEEISRSERQGEDDSLDLQSTTPGTGDADGDGIADDQENYAPEKRNLSSRKDDSPKQEKTVHWHR